MNEQPIPSQAVQPPHPVTHYTLKQDMVSGEPSFSISNDAGLVCVGKIRLMSMKTKIDVYRDAEATRLLWSIVQDELVTLSQDFIVTQFDGEPLGKLTRPVVQSQVQNRLDVFNAAGGFLATVNQDASTATSANAGNMLSGLINRLIGSNRGVSNDGFGSLVPQRYTATANGQAIGTYAETKSIGVFYEMTIDFSDGPTGTFDRMLGLSAALLIAARHADTE